MELARTCWRPKPCSSLSSIFRSFIQVGLWVNIWHRNKTACSESNPVQSRRSKLMTCPRKARLLRFESNSTATSDGGLQKLGNALWNDSESITTKVCSPIGRKWNAMLECHVETCVELRFSIWRFFEQSVFENNHLLCYWPTIHNSIPKICPRFQVISSHLSEVNELLDEHWAKIVRTGKNPIPICVTLDNMCR